MISARRRVVVIGSSLRAFDNGLGDPAAGAFLTEMEQNVSQLRLGRGH